MEPKKHCKQPNYCFLLYRVSFKCCWNLSSLALNCVVNDDWWISETRAKLKQIESSKLINKGHGNVSFWASNERAEFTFRRFQPETPIIIKTSLLLSISHYFTTTLRFVIIEFFVKLNYVDFYLLNEFWQSINFYNEHSLWIDYI